MEHMNNIKEAERAAAEEENSDIEAHLTISRRDVYDQVNKKGSILNDKRAVRPVNGINGTSEKEVKERSVRKVSDKRERQLRRSPRSPIKMEGSSSKRRSVRGNCGLNGDMVTVSPDDAIRRRPVRCRK